MIKSADVIREIGSNFCNVDMCEDEWKMPWNVSAYSLSGRTSLMQIVDDIAKKRNIKTAYLPSYCCESMITPFTAKKINVRFYDVILQGKDVGYRFDDSASVDVILSVNYFGLETAQTRANEIYLRKLYPEAIIIRDMTHSLFLRTYDLDQCEYAFASIRKWSGFSDGGIAIKLSDGLMTQYTRKNETFLSKMDKGKKLKRDFLENKKGEKRQFLELFKSAEEILDNDYERYTISDTSLWQFINFDIETVISKRRKNYRRLFEKANIMREKGVFPLFGQPEENEIPLFFPVILQDKKYRDDFRRYLIENQVYCPVHWPLSDAHDVNEETRKIYDCELSLICDQRYDYADMDRILDLIYKF